MREGQSCNLERDGERKAMSKDFGIVQEDQVSYRVEAPHFTNDRNHKTKQKNLTLTSRKCTFPPTLSKPRHKLICREFCCCRLVSAQELIKRRTRIAERLRTREGKQTKTKYAYYRNVGDYEPPSSVLQSRLRSEGLRDVPVAKYQGSSWGN